MPVEIKLMHTDDNQIQIQANTTDLIKIIGTIELAKARLLNPGDQKKASGIVVAHASPDLRATSPFGRNGG